MKTYFISDLHLTPEQPHVITAFTKFMSESAPSADRIYILGDLFEFWIGDDASSLLGAQPILDLMKSVSEHTPCYFIPGNRDFLVRDQFSQDSGFEVLKDETVIDLYGTPTLLLHGDSMCTDDVKHQEFRDTMMTNKEFCDHFLSLPIQARIEQAKQARSESHEHKSEVSMEIMDVTLSSVDELFKRYNVTQMIHGHTHRQKVHQHNNNTRYVLGDWGTTNSVLTATNEGLIIENHPI
ncbi:UDP-2,3-diacylglucosamine diphosphatase [Arenicella sp. 4NH20-0111]|uniref:UDP-2,3-diacylglucosamine diphosphatase n=1 Tax=Arenicella sp. 4NH20-0111 TaxID=3127648 RepID=UPI003109A424